MTTHSNIRYQNANLKRKLNVAIQALKQCADELKEDFITDSYHNPTYFIGPPSANSIRNGSSKKDDWVILQATTEITKAQVVKAVDDMVTFGKRQ